jgi:hypothetical protein
MFKKNGYINKKFVKRLDSLAKVGAVSRKEIRGSS